MAKDTTYKQVLDKYGFPLNSPITEGTVTQGVVPWKFGIEQKIQAKRIKMSQAAILSFQKQQSGAFAFGTIGNGGTLTLTSTLTPAPPHALEPMFAVPYAAVYLGTSISANGQIYPAMGTAIGSQFPVLAGLDYQVFNGTAPEWRATVTNNSGGNATIGFNILWQYLWFNQGTTQ